VAYFFATLYNNDTIFVCMFLLTWTGSE